jgi:hypothetical protein
MGPQITQVLCTQWLAQARRQVFYNGEASRRKLQANTPRLNPLAMSEYSTFLDI